MTIIARYGNNHYSKTITDIVGLYRTGLSEKAYDNVSIPAGTRTTYNWYQSMHCYRIWVSNTGSATSYIGSPIWNNVELTMTINASTAKTSEIPKVIKITWRPKCQIKI